MLLDPESTSQPTLAPSIAALPPELLGAIMLQEPMPIDHKFNVSQVSRYWRSVAFGMPRLWSSFEALTRLDFLRLPLVLERSGQSTMLDAHLIPNLLWAMDSAGIRALVAHAARIRNLHVDVLRVHGSPPLLTGGMHFLNLETLYLRLGGLQERNFEISFSAPNLRKLEVRGVRCDSVASLLSPNLQDISILTERPSQSSLATTFSSIFEGCPRLERLAFLLQGDFEAHSQPTDISLPPAARQYVLQHLHSLQLRLPGKIRARILERWLFADAIRDITCNPPRVHDTSVPLIPVELMQGIGPIVAFEASTRSCITMRGDSDRVRTLETWSQISYLNIPALWTHLCERYALHKSVRRIEIRSQYWDNLARGLADSGPQYDIISQRLELRLLVDGERAERLERLATRSVRLPTLETITFVNNRNSSGEWGFIILHFLNLIQGTPHSGVTVAVPAGCVDTAKLAESFSSLPGGRWSLRYL